MRRSVLFSAALAAALLSSPAFAAGGAAEAVSYSWTGMYGGVNASYAWYNADWDFSGGMSGSTSQNTDGGSVGLQAGYGAQIGEYFYLGAEASIHAMDLEGSSSCGGQTCKSQINSISDISARLGLISGPALVYAKGGLAYQDVTNHLGGNNDGSDNVGFILGAGVEYPLLYNLSTKLEYDYYHFGSTGDSIGATHISASDNVNLVKLGFNLRFD